MITPYFLMGYPLEGALVSMRPFRKVDISQVYIGWLNNPEVVRYSNQRFYEHTYASCCDYLASFARSDNYFFLITDRFTNLPLGTLTVYRNLHHGTADIGIMVGETSAWGCGIGTDAFFTVVKALVQSSEVRKITAGTLIVNKAMIRIMQNSGLELDAVRSGQEIFEGEHVDLVYYARFCNI